MMTAAGKKPREEIASLNGSFLVLAPLEFDLIGARSVPDVALAPVAMSFVLNYFILFVAATDGKEIASIHMCCTLRLHHRCFYVDRSGVVP